MSEDQILKEVYKEENPLSLYEFHKKSTSIKIRRQAMNTMKGFYASITSTSRLHGSYLEALSEITRMSRQQAKAVQSEMTWQDWSQPNQKLAAQGK
jgi:hypothetical protein